MNSMVCVDANIAIRSLVYGAFSKQAIALLRQWSHERTLLVAPSLFVYEVVSTLRRFVYLKELTPEEGEEAFSRFVKFKIRLSNRPAISTLSWQFARQFNRPRAYDTAYLALAHIYKCDFWTADEKLYNAVHQKLSWVRWIGNYTASP